MQFVTTKNTKSLFRTGKITFQNHPNKCFETPLYMIYTRRGTIPHLTPDLWACTLGQPCILNICFWDIYDIKDVVEKFAKSKGKRMHDFFAIEEFPVFINLRDGRYQYSQVVTSKNNMSGMTRVGKKTVCNIIIQLIYFVGKCSTICKRNFFNF